MLRHQAGDPADAGADDHGHPVRVHHVSLPVNVPLHVGQTWNDSHRQWNHGAMDGFVTTILNVTFPPGCTGGSEAA